MKLSLDLSFKCLLFLVVAGTWSQTSAQIDITATDGIFNEKITGIKRSIFSGVDQRKMLAYWSKNLDSSYTREEFNSLTMTEFVVQVPNANNPDDIYDLIDTVVEFILEAEHPSLYLRINLSWEEIFAKNTMRTKPKSISCMGSPLWFGTGNEGVPLFHISYSDLEAVLSLEEMRFLNAMNVIYQNVQIPKNNVRSGSHPDIFARQVQDLFQQKETSYSLDSNNTEIAGYYLNQALIRASELYSAEKGSMFYHDNGLQDSFHLDEKALSKYFITQIQNPMNPDDEYDMIDTAMKLPFQFSRNFEFIYMGMKDNVPYFKINVGGYHKNKGGSGKQNISVAHYIYVTYPSIQPFLKEWDKILLKSVFEEGSLNPPSK